MPDRRLIQFAHADPMIEGAEASLDDGKTDQIELPAVIWEFFGYPRHVKEVGKSK
jgi:hypothetical protein